MIGDGVEPDGLRRSSLDNWLARDTSIRHSAGQSRHIRTLVPPCLPRLNDTSEQKLPKLRACHVLQMLLALRIHLARLWREDYIRPGRATPLRIRRQRARIPLQIFGIIELRRIEALFQRAILARP